MSHPMSHERVLVGMRHRGVREHRVTLGNPGLIGEGAGGRYGSPLTQRKAPGVGDDPQAGSTALQAAGAGVTTAPLQAPPAPRSICTNPNCSMENPEACWPSMGWLNEPVGGEESSWTPPLPTMSCGGRLEP